MNVSQAEKEGKYSAMGYYNLLKNLIATLWESKVVSYMQGDLASPLRQGERK